MATGRLRSDISHVRPQLPASHIRPLQGRGRAGALPATDVALDAPDTLEPMARAPDPAAAARLTTAQVSAALNAPAAATSPPGPSAPWTLSAVATRMSVIETRDPAPSLFNVAITFRIAICVLRAVARG